MSSIAEICNLALGNIGIQKTIVNIDETSVEAKACKRFYDHSRKVALRDSPWPFATRFITLALVEENPNGVWAYSYRYPSYCEKVRRIIPSSVSVDTNYRDPYTLSNDASGRLIYSNQINAIAEITYNITDTTLFDQMFVDALSWAIGMRIAPSLTGNNHKLVMSNAYKMYIKSIEDAANSSFNEENISREPYSETIQARE